MRRISSKVIALTVAGLFAATLLLQYPVQTMFPIGGDVTRYIFRVEDTIDAFSQSAAYGLKELATNSRYPGSITILSTSKLLPISWPERFTWWMVLGHAATTAAIGIAVYRIFNWKAAAIGIATWPLTLTQITKHVEDGTMAQLWSLAVVPLFLERIHNKSFIAAALLVALAFLLHPITGGILAVTAALTISVELPTMFKKIRTLKVLNIVSISIALGVVAIAAIAAFNQNAHLFQKDIETSTGLSMHNLIFSLFGPFMITAPIGFAVMIYSKQVPARTTFAIGTLGFISLLLAQNDKIGIGAFTNRFDSYLVITTVITAAIGLQYAVQKAFASPVMQSTFLVTLLVSSGLYAWNRNEQIFAFYEYEGNYARLHPGEQDAIEWLRNNTDQDATVVSTEKNRHSEWIPIISNRTWTPISSTDALWQAPVDSLQNTLTSKNIDYIMLFKHRESPTEQFSNGVETLPHVYETDAALILQNTHGD